jgi:TRAP-type C4-dicarboxylate transport system substrate-binding protein
MALFLIVAFGVSATWAAEAAKAKAPAAKAAAQKAPAAPAGPATRDNRPMFGYKVDGLPKVKLIMISDSPFGTVGDVLAVGFEKMVEMESKGQIEIDHHRFGSLYTGNDLPKILPMGTVDIGSINKGFLMTKTPSYAPWVIAYIWKSPEHMMALTGSPEWYKMEEELSIDYGNIKPLSHVAYGNWDYWANREIKTIKDFGGTRFWSYGELSNAYVSSWGGTPLIQARAEMYMSYYRKAIAGISSSSTVYLDYKYYDAGKYWLHMPTYPPGSTGFHYVQLYINRKKWESLPEAYKKILIDASDLYSWASIWEIMCLEKASEFQLVTKHGMIDVGISTKTPEEYKKICDAAVAAGEKYALEKRKVPQAVFDSAKAVLAKYADPKLGAAYTWWYELAWAEADKRLAEAKKRIGAGEKEDVVWEAFHPKRFYEMPYDKMKAEWMKIPRCVRNWPMDQRLK